MAGSLTTLYNQIVLELGDRQDLLTNGSIQAAVATAINVYQKERFRFNENQPLTPFDLFTVPQKWIYTSADDARIGQLFRIDYINYLLGSTNNKMGRDVPENIYLATINGTYAGPPGWFAYDGNSIAIYPAPDIVYQLTIGGYWALPAPTDVNDTTSPWTNEAERLIRSRAKYEIFRHVTRNDRMAAAMSPYAEAPGEAYFAFSELKGEAARIKSTGRVRAMRF